MSGSRSRPPALTTALTAALTAALGMTAAMLASPAAVAAPASHQDVYVSPSGSDHASGARSATISAADFDRRGYAEVAGLTDGTPYTVTVTASNTAGTGAPSLAAPAVTPGPGIGKLPTTPGKPKTNTSATAVSLQWAPPTDSGDGQVIGYKVTVSDGRTIIETGRDVVVTQQSAKTMIRVVGGLKPATAYTLTIAAITGEGTGPAVTTTVTTAAT